MIALFLVEFFNDDFGAFTMVVVAGEVGVVVVEVGRVAELELFSCLPSSELSKDLRVGSFF